jgi:hypothetical protein
MFSNRLLSIITSFEIGIDLLFYIKDHMFYIIIELLLLLNDEWEIWNWNNRKVDWRVTYVAENKMAMRCLSVAA